MLSKNPEIVNQKVYGRLPIHFAAEHSMRYSILLRTKIMKLSFKISFSFTDKESIVKIFLDLRPDMIDVKSDQGYTPLFYAAAKNGKFPFDIFCC